MNHELWIGKYVQCMIFLQYFRYGQKLKIVNIASLSQWLLFARLTAKGLMSALRNPICSNPSMCLTTF